MIWTCSTRGGKKKRILNVYTGRGEKINIALGKKWQRNGHFARFGEILNACRIILGKSDGERFEHRCENNLKNHV